MPLYEYKCASCSDVIEVIQKFADEPLTVCEKCGGALERVISAPALQFKGTGWYITDYGRSGSRGGEGGKEGGKKKGGDESSSSSSSSGSSSGSSKSDSGSASSGKSDSGSSSSSSDSKPAPAKKD